MPARSKYNKSAVDTEIRKAGVKANSREAKMIHALLQGRTSRKKK